VKPEKCVICHPWGDPGKCNLSDYHGTSCVECHFDCLNTTTTTTSITPPPPTTTTAATKICPCQLALRGDVGTLETLRSFRDEVLNTNALGKAYTNLYYLYTPEITLMMLLDEDLRLEAADVLVDLSPEIEAIVENGKGTISTKATSRVKSLLNKISVKASPGLKKAIKRAKKDLESDRIGRITIDK
jgi:hypothetical protein